MPRMTQSKKSRRWFLKTAATAAGAALLPRATVLGQTAANADAAADYVLRIKQAPLELAPGWTVNTTTYNGQFPGPLLRLKEGQQVTVDVFNDTEVAEQLHWHGQMLPVDVDGAAEEGTPFIPAHGKRRIVFTPGPSGFRFYHTHNRAGADLSAGLFSGQAGPVYIEPRREPGNYDREVFLILKEFDPFLSQGGDMAMDFLAPAAAIKELQQRGEEEMKASLAKGTPHGYEVGYKSFTINGKTMGRGEPIRVKRGERVLFHILNASATEIRSLALPGHEFQVVALDGNVVPRPSAVPVLWLGTGERISAIIEMNHPGVWIMGDVNDDDRRHGMGIIVEYPRYMGRAQWFAPPAFRWNYLRFARPDAIPAPPDEVLEMTFAKENAAEKGFNRWTINGVAYPMTGGVAPASFHLTKGKRYRIRMRNATDDIHPIHLHRHSFELSSLGGQPATGIIKDVMMLGGYQEAAVDFVADNPGLSLFHCHQQLHMDYGFMTLLDYV